MSKFAKAILLKVTGDISTIKCNRSINLEVPQLIGQEDDNISRNILHN